MCLHSTFIAEKNMHVHDSFVTICPDCVSNVVVVVCRKSIWMVSHNSSCSSTFLKTNGVKKSLYLKRTENHKKQRPNLDVSQFLFTAAKLDHRIVFCANVHFFKEDRSDFNSRCFVVNNK